MIVTGKALELRLTLARLHQKHRVSTEITYLPLAAPIPRAIRSRSKASPPPLTSTRRGYPTTGPFDPARTGSLSD
jgi:hypothetical protein